MRNGQGRFMHRLLMLIPLKIVVGTGIFLFRDEFLGLAIWGAGILTIVWFFRLRRKADMDASFDPETSAWMFHVTLGIFMLLAALIVFVFSFSETLEPILMKTIIGTILIGIGLHGRKHVRTGR